MNSKSVNTEWLDKEARLESHIQDVSKRSGMIFVCFSGGVDSSYLLLKTVGLAGTVKVTAVTVKAKSSVSRDIQESIDFARKIGANHIVLDAPEFENRMFLENNPLRCYYCKLSRYSAILDLSENPAETSIFDGTQADDNPLDRPGSRAIAELGIFTPLATAGINKEEIRNELRRLGLKGLAEKKAEPCLATRIPFGRPLIDSELDTVRVGEEFLRNHGITSVRLRHHGDLARIVTDLHGQELLAIDTPLKHQVISFLKSLGFKHVAIDLEAYGSGA